MGSMTAFTDELFKIATALSTGTNLVKRFGKPVALMGTGAAAYHFGKKELDKTIQGRQLYDQVMAQQGQ